MKIAEITLAGSNKQDGTSRGFAVINRPGRSEYIEVKLAMPNENKTFRVLADCQEDVWSMADCLQYHLEGAKGTNSDIQGYYRILEHFMD